jgi:hypothetical protein
MGCHGLRRRSGLCVSQTRRAQGMLMLMMMMIHACKKMNGTSSTCVLIDVPWDFASRIVLFYRKL